MLSKKLLKIEYSMSKILDIENKLQNEENINLILNDKSTFDSLYSHYLTLHIHFGVTDNSLKNRLPLFGKFLLPHFIRMTSKYKKRGLNNLNQITQSIEYDNSKIKGKKKEHKTNLKVFKIDLDKAMRSQFIYKSYDEYKRRVYALTEKTVSKHKNKLFDINLRGRDYHLDHKFSIYAGWKSKILPELLASLTNLEIVSKKYNCEIKNKNCSISFNKLITSNLKLCEKIISKHTNRVN